MGCELFLSFFFSSCFCFHQLTLHLPIYSAGMFWLHDSYHDGAGFQTWKQKMWTGTLSAILTILAGLFICIAGLYVTIQAIVDAYADGTITAPFSC